MCKLRVLITDDHAIVRQGLRLLLNTDSEIEVVGEAANGAEAIQLALELKPDVILMDLVMPGMSGYEAIALIKRESPQCQILALTSVTEEEGVVEVVQAGAIGYIVKDKEAGDVVKAIKNAAAGQIQLSPNAVKHLARHIHEPKIEIHLTGREHDVLTLVVKGLTNKEIATRLRVSEETVKTHVSSVMTKLNAQSRTQAAYVAVKMGIVSG